jgi:hypothetical protein
MIHGAGFGPQPKRASHKTEGSQNAKVKNREADVRFYILTFAFWLFLSFD